MPINSNVEAARVPQQLLGELFVEKGLITPEELQDALVEQKSSGERIGQILVKRGLVSGPVLTTVLGEQLGVKMEKQEGFGSGLWSEIKRRHPRVGRDEDADEPQEPAKPPEALERRLALIDDVEEGAPEDPVDDDHAELESLRQQLSFASTRLDEERAGHKGTLRLLEDSRRELERLAREVDDWRDRAARGEDSDAKEQAAAPLAELEATVTELRAELEARERELAAGAESQTQLAAEASRLEDALKALRDEHSGSKDAIAALTAQVDELRVGAADAQRLLDEARREGSESQATVLTLTAQLAEQRASTEKLARKLEDARTEAAAFEATVTELRNEVSSREDTAQEHERALGELRDELAASEDARSRATAARVAAETELARRQSDARALSQDLQETRGAQVAARRELARLESRCAEPEPLEALLAQANADAAARTHSLAELTAELEAVQAELAERPALPPVEEPPATHLVFLRSAEGYSLAERPGPAPDQGASADVDNVRFLVSRTGPSPLPADNRRCAYLEVS